jgi:hypothetical protein
MSGIRRSLFMKIRGEGKEKQREEGCTIPSPQRLLLNVARRLNLARPSAFDEIHAHISHYAKFRLIISSHCAIAVR